jgi:hypothetical protein
VSRFRGGRGAIRADLGEAISFEDVLTVLTVLLLLRLVFMVPLVNLDKAKTISARTDKYWSMQALYVLAHPGDTAKALPYRNAFGLKGKVAGLAESGSPDVLYLEASSPDSDLTVVRHDVRDGRFIAMNVAGRGHSLSFRHGTLIWSQEEKEWFPASDSVDYGTRKESVEMEKEFREWTKNRRGY